MRIRRMRITMTRIGIQRRDEENGKERKKNGKRWSVTVESRGKAWKRRGWIRGGGADWKSGRRQCQAAPRNFRYQLRLAGEKFHRSPERKAKAASSLGDLPAYFHGQVINLRRGVVSLALATAADVYLIGTRRPWARAFKPERHGRKSPVTRKYGVIR